jgi:hypothetical protein
MRSTQLVIGAAFVIAILSQECHADTIHFRGGGTMKGAILKETESQVILRLKFTTTTLDKKEIDSIDRDTPEDLPDGGLVDSGNGMGSWEKAVGIAAKQEWISDLQPIPATVIDKGVLKNVPYKSFRSGDYEINIYGDPDRPAGIEIGINGKSLAKKEAKTNCIAFMQRVVSNPKDRQVLASLKLTQDMKESGGLTFEVTPETAEDAYGSWWVSIYHQKALEKARAPDQELKAITIRKNEVTSASRGTRNDETDYNPRTASLARSQPSGGSVYVRGYTRSNGTYVQPYTRSAGRR